MPNKASHFHLSSLPAAQRKRPAGECTATSEFPACRSHDTPVLRQILHLPGGHNLYWQLVYKRHFLRAAGSEVK